MFENHTYIQTIILSLIFTFFSKTFLQNNQCNYEFSQKKHFFDRNRRNDIFWYGEKIHNFCSKINNSKYLQNIKNFHTVKKFNILAFQRYKIVCPVKLKECQGYGQNKKTCREGGTFFVPNYTSNQKKCCHT